MKPNFLRWLGIVFILEMGILHLLTAQAQYAQAAYMGYLFVANFCGALLAALGIFRRQAWGWLVGAVVALVSIGGFIWSCTIGLPQMNIQEWLSPYGIVATVVETLFVLLTLLRPWKYADAVVTASNLYARYLAPFLGLVVIAALYGFANKWDWVVTTDWGHHVGSLGQVCNIPITTMSELEEKYGVQVSLAATSMMGSIVDVRIKIIDHNKAEVLLQSQAALLINQQVLILAPHMHAHGGSRLKNGKVFVMFFPAQNIIKPGTDVSLVVGPVRIEPVTVK